MREKKYNITETFIVEPTGDSPVVSACTNFYTNNVLSCSGNTEILLGEDVITFIGDVYGNNFDVDSISATTFYSGGTNLNDIILNNSIVNGSFNNEKLTLYKSNGSYIEVTGFTNTYTTGTTTINNIVYFNRNDSLSAYTLDLSSLNNDKFITGVTFNNNNLILYRNDGIQLQTLINNFSGLSINGPLISDSISAITISATTLYGDGSNLSGIVSKDTFVTGGTYSNGDAIFTNSSGGTFVVSGFSTFDCNDVVNCSEIINLSALTNSNTSNINILSNSLSAYTLNTIFDTYTGNTNSSLNYLQSEIDYLTGATSAYTTNSVFSAYTGNTNTLISTKQNILVSGTNIKTINNNSLVGSGNIVVSNLPFTKEKVIYYDDFIGGLLNVTTNYSNPNGTAFLSLATGARINTLAPNSGFSDAYGVVKCETQTSATASGFLGAFDMGLRVGQGTIVFQGRIRFETLSNSSQRYDIIFGLGSRTSYLANNQIILRYSDNINSGNFQILIDKTGNQTTQNTGVTVAINTWYNIEINISTAGIANFFINGANVGSIGTLPTGDLGAYFGWRKSIGTSNINTYIDYMSCEQTLTISR